MKINIEMYLPIFNARLSEYLGAPGAERVVKHIHSIVTSYLPCSACNELKPLDEFYNSISFPNRMHRVTVCKSCMKEKSKSSC